MCCGDGQRAVCVVVTVRGLCVVVTCSGDCQRAVCAVVTVRGLCVLW